jgi:hypothetical protein
MDFAIGASGIYLIIQAVFLVARVWDWNERLVVGEHLKILICLTVILESGSLIVFGVSYYVFTKEENCTSTYVFLSINLCVSVALFIASYVIEHGSIFCGAFISAYVCFLTVSGLMCVSECSRIAAGGQGVAFSVIASVLTLVWAGDSARGTASQFTTCGAEDQIFSLSFFHGLYALASMYITMIVTHWGQTGDDTLWQTGKGFLARWVNIGASWVIIALYVWTLIAPFVCPDREFGLNKS